MEEVMGVPTEGDGRVMPPDAATALSEAISRTEVAAARAHEWGRFWMSQKDYAHGRRWFATSDSLTQLAGEMRYQQSYILHPPPVGTPTRADMETHGIHVRTDDYEHGSIPHRCPLCGAFFDLNQVDICPQCQAYIP